MLNPFTASVCTRFPGGPSQARLGLPAGPGVHSLLRGLICRLLHPNRNRSSVWSTRSAAKCLGRMAASRTVSANPHQKEAPAREPPWTCRPPAWRPAARPKVLRAHREDADTSISIFCNYSLLVWSTRCRIQAVFALALKKTFFWF